MNFDVDQHLEITKAIINIIISSVALGLVQNKSRGERRFEGNAISLWINMHILLSHHNRTLYVIAYAHNVRLKFG